MKVGQCNDLLLLFSLFPETIERLVWHLMSHIGMLVARKSLDCALLNSFVLLTNDLNIMIIVHFNPGLQYIR